MVDSRMDEYAKRMGRIALSASERKGLKRICRTALAARAEATGSAGTGDDNPAAVHAISETRTMTPPLASHRHNTPSRRGGRSHSRRRILAVAAATVIALLGSALLSTPLLRGWHGEADARRSFALVAYADGTPLEERENTVLAAGDFLNRSTGWSVGEVYDENDEAIEGAKAVKTNFVIDLSSAGEDIEELRYSIDGDERVTLEYLPNRSGSHHSDALPDQQGKELVFGKDDLDAAGTIDGGTFSVRLDYLMPEDMLEPYEAWLSNGYDENAWEQLQILQYDNAASMLDGRAITITATFTDGSTLTHRYRIAPVEDFGTTLLNNRKALFDLPDDEMENYEHPALFTIEQLD